MADKRHLKRVVKAKPQEVRGPPCPDSPSNAPSESYVSDQGLVALMAGLRFDRDNDPSLKCPSCGEDIAIEKGQCPECHELIRAKDPHALESQVLPVIDAHNVVYVHLDVESGNLKFVQKTDGDKVALRQVRLEEASGMVPHFDCVP